MEKILSTAEQKKRIRLTVNKLPFDCWGLILQFFEAPSDFLLLSLSIPGLNAYVKSLTSNSTKNIVFRAKYFPSSGSFPYVKKLDLLGYTNHKGSKKRMKECVDMDSKKLGNVLTLFPRLEILSFEVDEVSRYSRAIRNPKSRKRIPRTRFLAESDSIFVGVSNVCPLLEKLFVRYEPYVNPSDPFFRVDVVVVAENTPNLRSITLEKCNSLIKFVKKESGHIMDFHQSLDRVSLLNCGPKFEIVPESCFKQVRKMKIRDTMIKDISGFTNLEKLDIAIPNDEFPSNFGVIEFPQLRTLKIILFQNSSGWGAWGVTKDDIILQKEKFPKLQKLSLRSFKEDFSKLLSEFSSLKKLEFESLQMIDANGLNVTKMIDLNMIKTIHPSLEYLFVSSKHERKNEKKKFILSSFGNISRLSYFHPFILSIVSNPQTTKNITLQFLDLTIENLETFRNLAPFFPRFRVLKILDIDFSPLSFCGEKLLISQCQSLKKVVITRRSNQDFELEISNNPCLTQLCLKEKSRFSVIRFHGDDNLKILKCPNLTHLSLISATRFPKTVDTSKLTDLSIISCQGRRIHIYVKTIDSTRFKNLKYLSFRHQRCSKDGIVRTVKDLPFLRKLYVEYYGKHKRYWRQDEYSHLKDFSVSNVPENMVLELRTIREKSPVKESDQEKEDILASFTKRDRDLEVVVCKVKKICWKKIEKPGEIRNFLE